MVQTSKTGISASHSAHAVRFLCMSPRPPVRGGGDRVPNAFDDLHDWPLFAACHPYRRSPLDRFHIPKSAEESSPRQERSADSSLRDFRPCHCGIRPGGSTAQFRASAKPAAARGAGETFSRAAQTASPRNNRRAGQQNIGRDKGVAASCPRSWQRNLAAARARRCDLT